MTGRMRAGTVMLIAALCAASACMGPSPDALTGLGIAPGGGSPASGRLAFLVQPSNVAAGSPISPEVKVEAVDTLGNVLSRFGGTVRVALGASAPGGLRGTTSTAATSGVAFFDTLVINQAGSGYTLVASASGMASVTSAPFTVSGATGTAARAP